jgi:hypothetical protein
VISELFIEIKDMTMAVSLTQDGDKAKDVSLKAKPSQ